VIAVPSSPSKSEGRRGNFKCGGDLGSWRLRTSGRRDTGVAGGEQNFTQIVQWAQTLSDAEKTAYNDAVKSGNVAAVKLAVSGMAAKYQQSYGRDPKLVGGRASTPGPEAFTSWAQVTKAMSDPRYDSDPAYRAEVENRIAASKRL